MVTEELAIALAPFFDDWRGPVFDQIVEQFVLLGVDDQDPLGESRRAAAHSVRVELVLTRTAATDPKVAWELFQRILALLRANGGFDSSSPNYPGARSIERLRDLLARVGVTLDDGGRMQSSVFESAMYDRTTVAGIRSIVERARKGSDDDALVVASSKELIEAAARCVLKAADGSYNEKANFAKTLEDAFKRLGLSAPKWDGTGQFTLSDDKWNRLTESIYIVACELARFRNEFGIGHGRPEQNTLTPKQARLAAEAGSAVAAILLYELETGVLRG